MKERVDKFLKGEGGMDSMEAILTDLVKDKKTESLKFVIKMAEDDYGGITYKDEFQNFALLASLNWHIEGIEGLTSMAIKNPSYRNLLNVSNLFSHLAASKLEFYTYYNSLRVRSPISFLDIKELSSSEDVKLKAREGLVQIAREVEKDDLFPIGLFNHTLQLSHPDVQSMQFAALVTRWFHFNKQDLEDYYELIHQEHDEQIYHENIIKNKILLEPFAAKIWSKPRFGERLVPDFLIRSIDDSYTVVEIEKPYLNIITQGGNLSAEATHAKKQVLDYRDWAITNNLYAKNEFPEIWRPFGLVVIGLEEKLTKEQKERLRQENESTQGVVKIVGFDWLYKRAISSFNNWLKFGFER